MPGRSKSSEYAEFIQEIVDDEFLENLGFEPTDVNKLFVSNLVQRSLSHLVGKTDTGSVLLRATAAGYLKVATYGSAIENDEMYSYSAQSGEVEQAFSQVVQQVVVAVTDQTAKIKFSADGVTYGDYYWVYEACPAVFTRAVKSYKITNTGATFSGRVYGEY